MLRVQLEGAPFRWTSFRKSSICCLENALFGIVMAVPRLSVCRKKYLSESDQDFKEPHDLSDLIPFAVETIPDSSKVKSFSM